VAPSRRLWPTRMRRRRRVVESRNDPDKRPACTTLGVSTRPQLCRPCKVCKVGPVCTRNFAVGQHGDGRHAGKRPGGTVAKREEEGPNRDEAAAAQQAHGEFLNDAQIAKEKWPSLLGRGGGLGG